MCSRGASSLCDVTASTVDGFSPVICCLLGLDSVATDVGKTNKASGFSLTFNNREVNNNHLGLVVAVCSGRVFSPSAAAQGGVSA